MIMNSKRTLLSSQNSSPKKKIKSDDTSSSTLHKVLEKCGLILKHPPEKCVAFQETIHIVRNIKKNLQNHYDYPRNVLEIFSNLQKECQNWTLFKHYLYPNIVKTCGDSPDERHLSDSVIKILLSVPVIQEKLIDFIFEKATELAVDSNCGPWIQMILKCICTLDSISNTEKVSTNLINLLDTSSETIVKLEIITALPDIIGDQEHNNIALEMSRILSEDHDLIPAILDCLSYLCLSNEQYEQLQKKTLHILITLSKCNHFPNFVKFLLIPGRISESAYFEAVQGLRNALAWPSSIMNQQDIASSQALTTTAIRNSMISSKIIANAWLKVVASSKVSMDYKPIDLIILLILYSVSEERQKQVEILIKKHIKCNVLKDTMMDEVFEKFKIVLRNNLKNLIDLTNSLVITKSDPIIETFASHTYMLIFSELEDCRQTVVAEILQLGLDRKQCVLNILQILNNVAAKDMALLKPHSLQMLTLLDRMDDMSLTEIRAVMNLLCGLAYTYENSVIRDDLHMIIRKELSSSSPTVKIQGIFAGVHAVKYLMATTVDEENTCNLPDNISYSSVTHLSEGDLREAAQIIELISRSTRQFPDLITVFYDELSNIIHSAPHINKHFLSWLTDAVTNDLQQNFIVDVVDREKIGALKLSMQYCLNAESETDEIIAINIAGLTLQSISEININILSPLFLLVQTLHSKQHDGDLSSIDALLGCAIVMPSFDIDILNDMESSSITSILDCLFHCVNWLRELLNAFSAQDDDALKVKIIKRIVHTEELETLIGQILFNHKLCYKPPVAFNISSKYIGESNGNKAIKISNKKQKAKKTGPDETIITETAKSQATQGQSVKDKIAVINNLPFRKLTLKLVYLCKNNLLKNQDSDDCLNIKCMNFLLKTVNNNLKTELISRIKRKTFLSKQEHSDEYDPEKAESCAKLVHEVLPYFMNHLNVVTSYIESSFTENNQDESRILYTTEMLDYLTCLENLYNLFTIYFKWMGFKNNVTLLKSSLRIVVKLDEVNVISLKDLLLEVAKLLQKHENLCLQLSTALSLIEFMKAINEYSDSTTIKKILKDMAQKFLAQQWKSPDGVLEKGLIFNQSVDKLLAIYFMNSEMTSLKSLTLQLNQDAQLLKSRNDTLMTLKCINKSNFPVLFRNLGAALYETAKSDINKGLTNSEHLILWKDVASILKYMSDIVKVIDSRNNLTAFFKKSLPILKLFVSQGIPILELQFKKSTDDILELLKILQQSTRFLQSLCCHSRLKKDTVLMSKVPFMRQLLEQLIYKVKAVLVANNCSQAFWMGNLKNKNIHGDIIATQQSIVSEDSVEDCDDQLPEDDDETDEELLNPDSNSISDIV